MLSFRILSRILSLSRAGDGDSSAKQRNMRTCCKEAKRGEFEGLHNKATKARIAIFLIMRRFPKNAKVLCACSGSERSRGNTGFAD